MHRALDFRNEPLLLTFENISNKEEASMKSKLTMTILASAALLAMSQASFAQGMAPNPNLTKEQQEALKNGRTPDTQKNTAEGSNNNAGNSTGSSNTGSSGNAAGSAGASGGNAGGSAGGNSGGSSGGSAK
jgi:hypothetical protein